MYDKTHEESGLSRKAVAQAFLELAAAGKVRDAYVRYVGHDFRHHNAYFGGDAQALLAAMKENAKAHPHKVFSIQHTIEDGNFVAVHSHLRMSEDDRGAAVVHIFRFEGERIVEMWDVGQDVPEDSPNENGMF